MIGRLRGEVAGTEGARALIDVGGVGYEVLLPESVLLRLPSPGESVTLLTRQVFREDGVTLYGFLEPFQRRLFDLLTEVKGCGPKIALSLIGQLGEDAVAGAIQAQDARSLSRASGVGPRLAERIILELREKIQEQAFMRKIESATRSASAPEDEVVDALIALGYRRNEAESAAEAARAEGESLTSADQIRLALRTLKR